MSSSLRWMMSLVRWLTQNSFETRGKQRWSTLRKNVYETVQESERYKAIGNGPIGVRWIYVDDQERERPILLVAFSPRRLSVISILDGQFGASFQDKDGWQWKISDVSRAHFRCMAQVQQRLN